MTILEPNKGQQLTIIFIWSIVVLVGVASWSIFSYNKTVILRRAIRDAQVVYKEAGIKNADLKNQRFNVVDGKLLKQIAESRGFVKVRQPSYITISPEHVIAVAHE